MEISLIGAGKRIEAKLVSGSEKRSGLERVEQALGLIGSDGSGVESEGLSELGGGERHYSYPCSRSLSLQLSSEFGR